MNIHEIAQRVIEAAPDAESRKWLEIDKNYGAPYSFWRSALNQGLVTQAEYDQAKAYYDRNDLWHYRGD